MKQKQLSNLLTVAASPTPQRLVEFLIFIYIIQRLNRILRDSPINKEESLDLKTVRSDSFATTLCNPELAVWRSKVGHEAYIGPIQEDGKLYVRRKTGNNVVMDIEYDPLRRRPKSLKTTLAEGQVEQSISYNYDKKGNITEITDRLNESRNQAFTYDALNRVTKAIGKYGTEDYSYHRNGNLLQRGQFALQYSNSNHVHAVTKVTSLQTGDTNYSYDTTGNLTERNGDVYRYNSQNKLTEITTAGGDVFQYSYDASGNRIKKQLKNANTTTYNFNNLYEIHRSPGEPEKHTLYIPGIEGDKVAQYTRSDALLVQANINENKYASIFTRNPDQNSIFDQRRNFLEAKETLVSVFQEIETDIALVWFNIPKPKLFTDNYNMLPSMRVLIWLLAFGILIYYALTLNTQEAFATRRLRLATSFALFPFFIASSAGCSPLFFGGAQGEEGTPPWLLLAAVPGDTPSVSDEPNFFGGGAGSGASTTNSARITGMYFYHPDHLGSITMITDGRGNVLAGGERGGKSHITYRPYGEILRTDSFGPDISKFKYTGQEEDRESGLYFYKSRYYDSKIGRFIQSDSLSFYMSEQGMNPYSYVEGNPISYNDPTGFAKCPSKANWLVAGAWSGNGACGSFKGDPQFIEGAIDIIIKFKILGLSDSEISNVLIFYYITKHPLNAVTPIDEASREHDSDDDGFFNGSKKNISADSNWIKNAWSSSPYYPLGGGFIPRPGYFKQQFKREFDAVGSKCKVGNSGVNARDLCAGINTFGTSLADYGVVLIGTGLFSTDIAISSIRKGIKGLSTIKQEKYYIRNDRFNNNLNLPKISITGKTKNLFKPGKWKL